MVRVGFMSTGLALAGSMAGQIEEERYEIERS